LTGPVENLRQSNGHLDPDWQNRSLPAVSQKSPQVIIFFNGLTFAFCPRAQVSKSRRISGEVNLSIMIEPTDRDLIENITKEIIRDGEKRLMLAVLENATEDFQKYVLATDSRGKQLFQDAEEWIMDKDDPSFFSFQSICDYLHLDPSYMRHGFMRWKAARLSRQESNCLKIPNRRVG
jgi:hypothetical protein